MKVKIKKLHEAAVVPKLSSAGAACFDLCVMGEDWGINAQAYGVEVSSGGAYVFKTGLSFEIPAGFVMLIFSRSGHGFKNDVRLANCVGVIDSDYRGEVMVKLTNDSRGPFRVFNRDRIAQAMILPVLAVEFELAEELSDTARGSGGFGSTGK
jgi:dUTP pyrophosphatase